MIEFFFAPFNASFAVAIGLMILIAAFEVVGALIGMSPSAAVDSMLLEVELDMDVDLDVDLDIDVDLDTDVAGGAFDSDISTGPDTVAAGPLSHILGWLCVGRVPILVLLVVFLTAFGVSGLAMQGLVHSLVGAPLPQVVAAILAFLAAIPATRFSGLALAAIMPKEQTEAVSQQRFIGKVATIVRGEARRDLPAEAKLTDQFGQTHYLLVEPDDGSQTFTKDTDVIVVKQTGSVYRAIPNTSAAMTDLE